MTTTSNSHPVLHRLRPLIVEDDPADAELIVSELRRSGFEVLWERVETEEQYLAKLAGVPEIVLADYSLPQFNGSRALELLQQQGLAIPFVVVSGTVGEEAANAIVCLGYNVLAGLEDARQSIVIDDRLDDEVGHPRNVA